MRTKDARDCYYDSTDQTSKIVRQLALAGIAVVWLFRTGAAADFAFAPVLFFALLSFGLTLTLDLLQYVAKSLIWGVFHYRKEQSLKGQEIDPNGGPSAEFDVPEWFNVVPLIFFWGKVGTLLGAGYFLASHLSTVIVGLGR